MASLATTTVFYIIFAVFFMWGGILKLSMPKSSSMFRAVNWKFTQLPWARNPDLYINDIRDEEDLYAWFSQVLIPGIFMETPEDGDVDRFCTEAYPCDHGEGDADGGFHDAEYGLSCEFGLKVGKNNCPSWHGPDADCCEPYEAADEAICNARCVSPYQDNCKSSAFCINECERKCREFLTDDLSRACAGPDDRDGSGEVQKLQGIQCPEAIGKTTRPRAPVVSSFNMPLFARLTLKRYVTAEEPSHRFRYAVETKKAGGGAALAPDRFNAGYEDTARIGTRERQHEYKFGQGFANGGGYVKFLDLTKTQASVVVQLAQLKEEGWFEKQATMAVELFLFNGNIDKFMKITYIFAHTGTGTTEVRQEADTFDLTLYEWGKPGVIPRFVLEVVTWLLFLWLVLSEAEDMTDDFAEYVSRPVHLIDLSSLTLSAISIGLSLLMAWSVPYMTFQLPVPRFADIADYELSFQQLEHLASLSGWVNRILAVNICIVCVRTINLISQMTRTWGIVVNTLIMGGTWFMYFTFLFICVFCGFLFMSYFTFGHAYLEMSSLDRAFLSCFKMVIGISIYDELVAADYIIGVVFFHVFVLLFTFVLLNVFLAIIINAYASEMKRVENSTEADPLVRLINNAFDKLMANFTFLRKFHILRALGGGSTRHTNEEHLQELQRKQKFARVTLCSFECIVILFFVVLYMVMLSNISNLDVSFAVGEAVQNAVVQTSWQQQNPAREVTFHEILQLEDAAMFTEKVLLDQLYGCSLEYDNQDTSCRNAMRSQYTEFRPNFQTQTGACPDGDAMEWPKATDDELPNSRCSKHAKNTLVGYAPTRQDGPTPDSRPRNNVEDLPENYLPGVNDRQPRLNQWNVAIDPWNFVRVTIQLNCFRSNPNQRWSGGYLYIMTPRDNTDCSEKDCMNKILEEYEGEEYDPDLECLDYDGFKVTIRQQHVVLLGRRFNYTFTARGKAVDRSYKGNGGYTIGMGMTWDEAKRMFELMYKDRTFAAQTSSIVFDFATYNGNVDLVTHSRLLFSLEPTGIVQKNVKATTFPLTWLSLGEIFPGTGPQQALGRPSLDDFRTRTTWYMFVYLVVQVGFMCNFIKEMYLQYLISWERGSGEKAIFDFFIEDYWHVVDVVSLSIAYYTLYLFFCFLYYPLPTDRVADPGYQPDLSTQYPLSFSGSFTQDHRFVRRWNLLPEDEDAFILLSDIATLGELWESIVLQSALNSFLLMLRVMKYLPSMTQLKVLLRTIHHSIPQILVFGCVLSMLLVGFVIMFHVEYGIESVRFRSFASSAITLFRWLVGDFEITVLFATNPSFTTVMVPVFMAIFYFVLANLFLAIFVRQWRRELEGAPIYVNMAERKKTESPELGEAVNDLRVMRGPGWDHGQEDGGPDGRGNIIRIKKDDHQPKDCSVTVRWDHGGMGDYRVGTLSSPGGGRRGVLMTVSEARCMSLAESFRTLKEYIMHTFAKKFLGGASVGFGSSKDVYLVGKDWVQSSALHQILHKELDDMAKPENKDREKPTERVRRLERARVIKIRAVDDVKEKARLLHSAPADDGGGALAEEDGSPKRGKARGSLLGGIGKHHTNGHAGPTLEGVGFLEKPFPPKDLAFKRQQLGSEEESVPELLQDMLISALEWPIPNDETEETFVSRIQRLCLGPTLPKARSRKQQHDLRVEKTLLAARLQKFHKVLHYEAQLKALDVEFHMARELHTVLLRQNLVLVDHCTKLEEDLATSRQQITQKQQAVGAFRRACEDIT